MLEEIASVWGFLRLSMCVVVHTYNSHTWEAGQVDLCIPDLQTKFAGGGENDFICTRGNLGTKPKSK